MAMEVNKKLKLHKRKAEREFMKENQIWDQNWKQTLKFRVFNILIFFPDAMAMEANKKLKLCKRQARRVYEILRLHYVQKAGGLTDKNQAYKDYRVAVKKRLNKPFQVSWKP